MVVVVTQVSPQVTPEEDEELRRVRLKQVGAVVGEVAKATRESSRAKGPRKEAKKKKKSPRVKPKPKWASSGCSRAKERTPGRGTVSQRSRKERRKKERSRNERRRKEKEEMPKVKAMMSLGANGSQALARDRLETRQRQSVAERRPVPRPSQRAVVGLRLETHQTVARRRRCRKVLEGGP